jgi:hypothetical protein
MAGEPENMVLIMLRGIPAKQEGQSQVLADRTRRFDRLEKRLNDLSKIVQSAETQFRQSQQESRIDDDKLEQLLNPKEPA